MSESTNVFLGRRGTVTLPAELREKYRLEPGEVLSLLDLDGVFILAPRVSVVDKLTREIQALREQSGLSLEDLLSGLPEERRRLFAERLSSQS